MKKDNLIALIAALILVALFLVVAKLGEPTRRHPRIRQTVSPKLENPLYIALFSGMSSDRFATLVASNSQWVNQADKGYPQPLLCVAADFGLTNHVIILMQHGANVEESLSYASKYAGFGGSNAVSLIRHCEQLMDVQDGSKQGKSN